MTKVIDCCIWCHKICTRPKGFDPKKSLLVCSDECAKFERSFRVFFSDENIGLRYYEQYGVNPNHRGRKKGGKT